MSCALAKGAPRAALPFDLYTAPPIGRGAGFHLIRDQIGDIIGSLPWQTGDHPPEEQLAYAMLFRASPMQQAALRKARVFIAGFEGDPLQEGIDDLLAEIDAALMLAEGAP